MVDFGKVLSDVGAGAENVINGISKFTSSSGQQRQDFNDDGFVVSSRPTADGTGLPSSKQQSGIRGAEIKRKLIHWFVPEFGIVKMYVNPNSIQYRDQKLISSTMTKGGYVVQYWGEEQSKLTISGTTGSSGIEGINVLKEVYRAEQLAFDSVGLTLASQQQVSGISSLIDQAADGIFGTEGVQGELGDVLGGAVGGLLTGSANSLLPQNVPSLAALAVGVEMYHDNAVYRGYFTSFSMTESAEKIGLFDYMMEFIVTQRRGYRTNSHPWQRSAVSGPSDNSTRGGIPLTYALESATRNQQGPFATTSVRTIAKPF